MALEIMPIRVHGVWIALQASVVQEVVGRQRFIAVPNASPAIPGVLPWRGRAIALVDLARVTGLSEGAGGETGDEPAARHVVISAGDCTLALPVEAVREVQSVSESSVQAQNATRMRFSAREVTAPGGDGDALMPVLDVDELVRALAPEAAAKDAQ